MYSTLYLSTDAVSEEMLHSTELAIFYFEFSFCF